MSRSARIMNAKFALTLLTRAEAARKRVAALEARATRSPKESDSLKVALDELDVALEEVRIAADQLHAAMDDLMQARRVASDFEERYRELHERLPLPCVLTNELGCVDEANASAASLLNVAPRFLSGKPLLLFFPERDQYFELIESVRSSGIGNARLTVRPRDRKPKQMSIDVSTMPQQVRWCWVFSEVA
jgi:PAS domain-containing protein